MATLLAVVLAAVVAYCLARSILPGLQDPEHGRDLDVWHVVMSVAMLAMLLVTLARPVAVTALAVFVVATGWALARVAAPGARAAYVRTAYVRLGVGSAAMVVMLLPNATATATAATAGPGGHHHHAAAVDTAALAAPTALVVALLVGLGAILLIPLAGSLRRSGPLPGRLAAACEVAMALAMGTMLVGLL